MSKRLTEELKNGDLQKGLYYLNDGLIIDFCNGKTLEHYSVDSIYEVLEEVPSYYEWDMTNKDLKDKARMVYNLIHEKNELKHLLEQCRPAVLRLQCFDESEENAKTMLLKKIDEELNI